MVTLDSGPLSAIDIGSNSFRLEIGQLRHGRYRRIDYLKDVVRLGAGLDDAGRLTESAVQRGLDSLQRFAARLHGFAPSYVRAVATQTLREASNRNAFLARAEQVLGYPVEIISGREEARLIYVGVATLQPSPKARLVIDIGGRSTEMILGQGATPNKTESFAVGSVSLSMRYFGDGRLDAAAFRAAQIAAGAEFEEALATFAPPHWQEAMGSSGTVGAVSEVLLAAGITDSGITSQALAWMIERCIAAGHVDLLQLPGLRADRRAVLPGGLAILYTLLPFRHPHPVASQGRTATRDRDRSARAARCCAARTRRRPARRHSPPVAGAICGRYGAGRACEPTSPGPVRSTGPVRCGQRGREKARPRRCGRRTARATSRAGMGL